MGKDNKKITLYGVLIGIFIPVILMLVPLTFNYYENKADFSYYSKQISTYEDKAIINMGISNNSKLVEKNVELRLLESDQEDSEIRVHSSIGYMKPTMIKENGNKIFSLGDLRAGQSLNIELFRFWKDKETYTGQSSRLFWPGLGDIRVISSERVAEYRKWSREKSKSEVLRPWAWVILVLAVIAFVSVEIMEKVIKTKKLKEEITSAKAKR